MLVDTSTPRPGARSFPVVVGLAVVIVAAAVGWFVAGATAPEPEVPVTPNSATVGSASFTVPGTWTPAAARRPGVRAFATDPGLPARALVAFDPRPDRTLVPATLRAGIEADLGRPRQARLGGLAAWSYGPVQTGQTVAQFTVTPTTAGVLGVACTAPAETWNVAMDCHASVDSVTLVGAGAVPPQADVAFRLRLSPTLAALGPQRVQGRAALRKPRTRAAAARRLAAAHGAAASKLAPVASAGAPAALVAALRREAKAYRSYGRATRGRPTRRAARRAGARVVAAETAFRRALARVR
jgi:hypothetical protein